MGRFNQAEQKLWMALSTLAGSDPQRKRLETAYVDYLSGLQDAELPGPQQARFAQLRDTLTHGRQLHPEIAIAGMSDAEVAELARQIPDLYHAVIEASSGTA